MSAVNEFAASNEMNIIMFRDIIMLGMWLNVKLISDFRMMVTILM